MEQVSLIIYHLLFFKLLKLKSSFNLSDIYIYFFFIEKGKFIGVEMGCNHVKTYLLTFGENSKYEVNSKSFEIPQNFKISNGLDLFNYLAECLATFMSEQGVFNEFLGIGFTFSFPLQQLSLTKGILTKWTKGFTCSHVVGKDVGLLFQEACDKRGVSY